MRVPLALLVLGSLSGCNVVVASMLTMSDPAVPASEPFTTPFSFSLAPRDAEGAASKGAEPAPTALNTGLLTSAAEPAEHVVRLTGAAIVNPLAVGIANVLAGRVTGSTVRVLEAMGGQKVASGVTFFDGSFSVEVRFRAARQGVVLVVDLVDAADPAARATLAAPVLLHAGEGERRLAITPGSTALVSFLGAVARSPTAGKKAEAVDPADLVAVAGPTFGGLVAGVEDDERESFAAWAEASPDLAGAASVATIRDGIRKFVDRLTVPEVER